jgi:hypothetical protein
MEQETAAGRKCSKCSGEMETGFVLDRTHVHIFPATWADGLVELNWLGGFKPGNRKFYRVETWRCKDCGYLESYARNQSGLYSK